MPESFDVGSLQQRYAFLDECPEQFVQDVVTLPIGSLAERIEGLRTWRNALLDGRLPSHGTWPPSEISAPARLAIESLGLLRFCRQQPELVDEFLRDVLASFARNATVVRSDVAKRLRVLEQLERRRLDAEANRGRLERRNRSSPRIDDRTQARLRRQAEVEASQQQKHEDSELMAAWTEHVRVWSAISEVFGDLGEMMGRGWDLSTGVLRHTGWADLVRLRELLEQLPQLREIIQSLGRLHATEDEESVAETVFIHVRRLAEELREVRTRHVPAETQGVERSGQIARMLPVEASNLGHPRLRFLWHARRAECALLTYRVEGISVERIHIEQDGEVGVEQRRPRSQRGPIIAVIDTSGSMHGLPERVAKAIALEALRTAHSEKRRCILFSYSGPGQVLEQELDLSPEGIGRLLAFLGQSFGGGNDEIGVLTKVVGRLEQECWKKADVVFVSDGEWPAPTLLAKSIEEARSAGTRFHGIQIGNNGRTGLHTFCEPVHVFQDWAAAGGW